MSTQVQPYKDFCIAKYRDANVDFLINRRLILHKQLERPARTYVAYSDLHGSYEKYIHWLKNGLGYYRIAISEILGSYYSEKIYEDFEKLFLIINRDSIGKIKRHVEGIAPDFNPRQDLFSGRVPKKFTTALLALENHGLSKKRIFKDLLTLLRCITRGDEHRIIKAVPKMFLENVLYLYFKKDRSGYESMIDGITENEKVYTIITAILIKLTLVNMYDKHINLGDIFDRGNDADKLLSFTKYYFNSDQNTSKLVYIWGNHDILWLGASIGNPVLCMTALRVSLRYSNIDFLVRYGFNLEKLRKFANSCYKILPSGEYAKTSYLGAYPADETIKMTKALLVLEAKLSVLSLREAKIAKGAIDYHDYFERYYSLLKLIPTGNIPEDQNFWDKYMKENPLYTDIYFPTVDQENPELLSEEENEVVNDIVNQFTSLPKFQSDMRWMFDKGEIYRVVDNTLFYHAALPANEDMELVAVHGLNGKSLLDFLQRDIKRISSQWYEDKNISIRDKMLFWYLWCGKDSPLFCKNKMATLERAIFREDVASQNELTTWTEAANPYYKHIREDIFLNKILVEFHADKIVMGHRPVQSSAQGILGGDMRAFIIDGGASLAYGDKGAVLIQTPDYTYVTFHPPLEELIQSEAEDKHPSIEISQLEGHSRVKLRYMDKGHFIKTELAAIEELLSSKLESFTQTFFS